ALTTACTADAGTIISLWGDDHVEPWLAFDRSPRGVGFPGARRLLVRVAQVGRRWPRPRRRRRSRRLRLPARRRRVDHLLGLLLPAVRLREPTRALLWFVRLRAMDARVWARRVLLHDRRRPRAARLRSIRAVGGRADQQRHHALQLSDGFQPGLVLLASRAVRRHLR